MLFFLLVTYTKLYYLANYFLNYFILSFKKKHAGFKNNKKKASSPISLLIIYYLWLRSYFYLPYSLENKHVYSLCYVVGKIKFFFFECNKKYQVEEKYLTILKYFNLTSYLL
jgi:hypothetical protein